MWSHLAPPTETVDLGGMMSRTYPVYTHLGHLSAWKGSETAQAME